MHPAALTGDGPAPALHGAGVPAMSSPLAVTCRSRYIWISTVCRLRSARPGGCLTTNQTPGRPALPATLTTQHRHAARGGRCSHWRVHYLKKSPPPPCRKHLLLCFHYGSIMKTICQTWPTCLAPAHRRDITQHCARHLQSHRFQQTAMRPCCRHLQFSSLDTWIQNIASPLF